MKFIDNGRGDGGSQDMVQDSGESAKIWRIESFQLDLGSLDFLHSPGEKTKPDIGRQPKDWL